ncbi:isocitrate lyase/phosphoenolpyruvate mutase family protein [Micrococcales bacterium 31B]|nr:isocitrate lyase/phosphoenolpyruvate mutase family protein [Micrococcales bacterium 31B]
MDYSRSHRLRIKFREYLAQEKCYDAASVFDPLSARMAHDLGFEIGILGGSVASLQVLGAPDIAVITLSEFAEQARRACRVAELPMIADADHGYGNSMNVMRTIHELERAGISALSIEDTLLPTAYAGRTTDLISMDEGIQKIRAAVAARQDRELVIIARTNVALLNPFESQARALAYQAAGADVLCLVGVRDVDHLKQVTEGITIPIMLISYNNPKLRDYELLAKMGVRICVNGHLAYFAAVKGTYDCLREQRGVESNGLTPTELVTKYSDVTGYQEWAREYLDVDETGGNTKRRRK